MENLMNRIVESKFMKSLDNFSMKLSGSAVFSTISSGMSGNLSFIMISAVIQIFLYFASLLGLETTSELYIRINSLNTTCMAFFSVFIAFNIASNYSKKLGMNGNNLHGFIAIICLILTSAPITTYALANETNVTAISTTYLGTNGMFIAIIIGFFSVRISKFVIDHNWTIKMPDAVPEGILNSFNAIIPLFFNLIIWYGLYYLVEIMSKGTLSLPTLIITILSVPLNLLLSAPGMIVIIIIGQLCWFFGIHGGSVIFSVLTVPYVAAYTTNMQLAAQGQPLIFSYVFLYSAMSLWGGAGNTLPLVIMGLKSKSKTLQTVSKAALPAGLFCINEPAIFGFPIMYNPTFLIPFVFGPIIPLLLLWGAYSFGLIGIPKVLIMTTLPVVFNQYIISLDWRNPLFALCMFPICYCILYPFFKVYEKQMVAREMEEEAEKEPESVSDNT